MNQSGIDRLREALAGLHDNHAAVEAAVKAFDEQDLSKENKHLREAVEHLNTQLQKSRDETAVLHQEYETLTNNFKHEMSSKRVALIGLSERQHQEYLSAGLERERQQIAYMYTELQKTITGMSAQLYTLDANEREPLLAETAALRERINAQVYQSQARKEAAWRDAANRQAMTLNEMKSSPVEDAAMSAVRHFFAWETFLGLKIISAIGALLLILGVFTFGRYLYINMGPALQCAAIFAFGILLMGTGEVFHRKKWRGGFTLALTASGSGILFLGAALGYMTLGVLPMWAALGICAGVSLLTFAASLRYNAQFIGVFALIGGYLPLIALEESIVFFGAIYFIILSLLGLLIATKKNWRVARFIGLGAGLVAQLMLMNAGHGNLTNISAIAATGIFISIGFMAYLVIPVFGAWFTKTQIKTADIVLLACNVFFSFSAGLSWGTIYAPASIPEWRNHTGAVAAVIAAFFAVSCIVMAVLTERQKYSGVPKSETGSLKALFFITSVTFSALVVLFALDSAWFSAGWLIQASGLALYGILRKRRRFNIAGLIIGVFCLLSFLFVNVPNYNNPLFVWQYLGVTLAAAVVSIVALKSKPEQRNTGIFLNIFRCFAIFNLWVYMVYVLHNPLMPALGQWLGSNATNFAALISITFGFTLAFLLPRIKRAYNYGFQISAIGIGIVNTVWLLFFNAEANGMTDWNMAMSIAVFVLYIIVNFIAIGWTNDLLKFMIELHNLPLGWYPLLISGGAVLLIIQNLVVQLSLGASSLILTLIFGITALSWVVFGFAKRNSTTRIGGLSMAFFAVIKLFVLDLYGLGTTGRIISYFTAGIILLTISFTYQWFSKRLSLSEKKSNNISPAEED